MTAAFKEWAVVVDALGHGDQMFILRKGGIHEGRGGFQPEFREFFLFPTLFHQQRESVVPTAQARYDQICPSFAPPDVLRLEYWAELIEWLKISDFEALRRLNGQHVWLESILAEKFAWGKDRSVFALALRVYRLPIARELPMLPEYGGCKSWIQLARPLVTSDSVAVLDETAFARKLAAFRAALQ